MSGENGLHDRLVECEEHGAQQATFVCRHLVESLRSSTPVGYVAAENTPENPRPDAWCAACEDMRLREGGEWNDRTDAALGVTLLCGACYDRVRDLNLNAVGGDGGRR